MRDQFQAGVAGGLLITGHLGGKPWSNAGVLAFGTAIASVVGTTGAAMILIRPLIRANAKRTHNVHVVVFFIFLVANIGGALSPLGDPPLFVGFLRGVDFFWPAAHLWQETLIAAALVLAMFIALDIWFQRREKPAARRRRHRPARPDQPAADRRHHRRHPAVGRLEARHRDNDLRHRRRIAEPRARRRAWSRSLCCLYG